MATYNNLPLYSMTVDETQSTGVEFISFVTDPAIEKNFVAFNSGRLIEKKYKFNTDKQLVSGPFMIPDMPIYRFDSEIGEYYVTFSKETIELIVKKFMKNRSTLAFNYQHEEDSQIDNAILLENWFVAKNDKSKTLYGEQLPEGTWFGTVYVENKEFWNNNIKTGDVKGFSIEGWLNMELSKIENKNKIKSIMSQKRTFKSQANTVDGLVIYADTFEVGSEVFTVDADGVETPLVDGEYTLEDGTKIVIAAGKITEVVLADTEMSLSADEISSIIADILAPYETRIKTLEDSLKLSNQKAKELETKLSLIPGVKNTFGKNDKDDKQKTKMSGADRAKLITDVLAKVKKK